MSGAFTSLMLDDLLVIADLLGVPDVRDIGLLDAAANRPAASAFGQDAYPTLAAKAAALFESLVRNHPLVDGNKRLSWTATVVLLQRNGATLRRPDDDKVYDFVVASAAGELTYDEITNHLADWII